MTTATETPTPTSEPPEEKNGRGMARFWLAVRIIGVLIVGGVCYFVSAQVMANHRGAGKPAAPATDVAARLLIPGVYEHDIIPGPVAQPAAATPTSCEKKFGAQAVGTAGDVQSKAVVHESVARFASPAAAQSYLNGVVACSQVPGSVRTSFAIEPLTGVDQQIVDTVSATAGDTTPDVQAHLLVGKYVLDVTLSARSGSPSADETSLILGRLAGRAVAAH